MKFLNDFNFLNNCNIDCRRLDWLLGYFFFNNFNQIFGNIISLPSLKYFKCHLKNFTSKYTYINELF